MAVDCPKEPLPQPVISRVSTEVYISVTGEPHTSTCYQFTHYHFMYKERYKILKKKKGIKLKKKYKIEIINK